MTATLTTDHVVSADGTAIAFDRTGSGPAVILVDGALCYRAFGPSGKVAAALRGVTVYRYDRRGRGESGEGNSPYTRQREVEDLAALVAIAGGTAVLVGQSSGAILAADAAAALDGVSAAYLYEPPVVVVPEGNVEPETYRRSLDEAIAHGRPGDAVKAFLRHVGAPAPMVAVMRLLPMWKKLSAVGPTLRNDHAICDGTQAGRPLPADRFAALGKPVLVASGSKSPTWMGQGARAMADALGGRYEELPKQTHRVKADVLAESVHRFLAGF